MPNTLSQAKSLRQNSTIAEKIVWDFLRNHQLGYKFRRQQPLGPFIGDFVCFDKKLIIEIDGGQHTPETDTARKNILKKRVIKSCVSGIIRLLNKQTVFIK